MAALLVLPHVGNVVADDEARWIIEPGPEAQDAQKLGASEVERAQKLAKAKQFADAASVLEAVSRKLPAAVHDCNLALAYLRASALTRAQLVWDLSGLRNGTRPKWCTGDVSTQLSTALRAAKFVPVNIDVVPHDAVVEVAGIAMRNMRTVWLAQGQVIVSASAPGFDTKSVTETVVAPTTRIAITLETPKAAEPDAGVAVPVATPDAAPVIVVPDAAVTAPVQTQPTRVPGASTPLKVGALSLAIAGWFGTGLFGYLTYAAREDGNSVYPTDPAFLSAKDKYGTMKWLTVGSLTLGTVATVITIYLFTRPDRIVPADRNVRLDFGDGSIGISYGGAWP